MADTNSTYTSANSALTPTKVDPELVLELRENAAFLNFPKWRSAQGVGAVGFPVLSTTVAMTAVTNGSSENDAVTTTALATTLPTATPAAKCAAVLASWILMMGSAVDLAAEIPGILNRAGAQLLDVDIAALFAGGSNVVGDTGVDLSLATLQSADITARRVMLREYQNSVFALHIQQYGDVNAELISGTGSGLAALMVQRDIVNWFPNGAGAQLESNYMGTLFGRPVFVSSNIPDLTAEDHGGALIVPGKAIGGAMSWTAQTNMYDQGVNHKPASSWFHTLAYGLVEIKDSLIITIRSDHV